MDLSKLTKGDKVFAGGVVLFFLAMFFDWFSVDVPGFGSRGLNGWDYGFWGVLMFLILLVLGVVLLVARFGNPSSIPKLPWPAIFLAGSAIVTLLTLLKLIIGESPLDRSFGIILALIGAAVCVFGAILKFQEGGGNINDLKNVDSLKKQFETDGNV